MRHLSWLSVNDSPDKPWYLIATFFERNLLLVALLLFFVSTGQDYYIPKGTTAQN